MSSSGLATVALALLAMLGFALVTSLLSALLWPALRRHAQRSHPERRAQWAFAVAVAPALLPLALLALCLAPGFASGIGLHEDHCLHHAEHAHLCFAHPTLALTAPLSLLLLAAGAGLLAALLGAALRLSRWQRQLAALQLGGSEALAPDARLISSSHPVSVTLGLWRPEICISSALAERLRPEQLRIVLEHERAHARRRDSLRRLVASVLSLPHWPWLRRALRVELTLACEQACDEAAARGAGDRLAVAETILAVERLHVQASPAHPALVAFAASAVEERVRSLVDRNPGEPVPAGWLAAAIALTGAWLLVDPLHHATEHVLGLLLRAW